MTLGSRVTSAGRALGDHPPLGQHVDVIAQAHHRLHDMLDHQDGDAVGDAAP